MVISFGVRSTGNFGAFVFIPPFNNIMYTMLCLNAVKSGIYCTDFLKVILGVMISWLEGDN